MLKEEFDVDFLPYAKIPSEKWKKANDEAKKTALSEPNDIIHAYSQGIDKGMITTKQILKKTFQDNLGSAFSLSEKLINVISSDEFEVNNVFLKACDIASFDVLVIVNSDSYLSDNRKLAYSKAREIKTEKREDFFNINFSFMPDNGAINYQSLESDGYIFKYETEARQA